MNTASAGAAGSALHRKDAILRLLKEETVSSQEELQKLLKGRGFAVAQPTLSRDLKELAVLKTPSGYVIPDEETAQAVTSDGARQAEKLDRLDRALKEFVSSVEAAGTMVVIKTPPAGAHPIAHHIDEAGLPEVAGTIAGENTVFLAAYSAAA